MPYTSFRQRKSPRLKNYDYSQSGAYFVTICTEGRQHLFGEVENSAMQISQTGQLCIEHWDDLPKHFPSIELDGFVVMPNHVHGILLLTEHPVGTTSMQSARPTKRPKLGTVIATYKAAVTRHVHRLNLLEGQIWQDRYNDHIIRNERSLNYVRNYVATNPERWEQDTFYD
jgi:putative transposase